MDHVVQQWLSHIGEAKNLVIAQGMRLNVLAILCQDFFGAVIKQHEQRKPKEERESLFWFMIPGDESPSWGTVSCG